MSIDKRLTLMATCLSLTLGVAHAGAWGIGPFDNDQALDWVEMQASKGFTGLDSAFRAVNNSRKMIDADDCSEAIAAAAVVAAGKDKVTTGLPPEVAAWVQQHTAAPNAQLVNSAKSALAVCRDPKRSELEALWNESKKGAEARVMALDALMQRLSK